MRHQSFIGVPGVAIAVAIAVVLVMLILGPRAGWAENLRDVVKNLYGGDGIRLALPPAPGPGVGTGPGSGGGGGAGTGGGAAAGGSHDPHFIVSSLEGLDQLGRNLASSLRTFSVASTVTAFTFDLELGVPVRTTDSLGPLLAQRAPTLGKGKLNLATSYTRLDFKRFQGTPLNNLKLDFQHEDSNQDGSLGNPEFEVDVVEIDLDLTIKEDIFALFATYGITRNWDVGVVIPIVHVTLRAEANATILRKASNSTTVHNFGAGGDSPHSSGGGDATGFGDLLLRSKYNFLRDEAAWPDLSILGQVKFATGNPDKLLGTGETNFLGLLIASKSFGWLTPYANLGYEGSTDPEQNNVRYLAGIEALVHPRVSVALDILGRWDYNRSGNGSNLVDLAVGAKWNPVGSFVVGTYFEVPLNRNEGLRPNFAWTIAAEYTF